jgi:hypothetical protein
MNASDFRDGRRSLMLSAQPLDLIHRNGPPRFLDLSFSARRLQPPRTTHRAHLLVESATVTGFTLRDGLAVADFGCNEAESSSLALQLTDLIPRASQSRITPERAGITT